ncbi:hypothetical protein P154DRAFT_439778, partial [Amniculicola lignicola CBS 123094]
AFPIKESKLISILPQDSSLLGQNAKILVKLPNGSSEYYFLKIATIGTTGSSLCEGEYESLKAIDSVCPGFVPKPYGWGKCKENGEDAYFLLEEFRELKTKPADPATLGKQLAELHQKSQSPTGKFGFHIKTSHGRVIQQVDQWDACWASLFGRHLSHFMDVAKPVFDWPEFDRLCDLTLERVVPRLLLPLQENGRVLKPSLIHGDCWDGNTANDAKTGNAIIFDACSFYGHNEYDTGNWRASRHKLSNGEYIRAYKSIIPPSEPVDEWDARNILYSLTFNIGNAVYIPGSDQREAVFHDLAFLCQAYCPDFSSLSYPFPVIEVENKLDIY